MADSTRHSASEPAGTAPDDDRERTVESLLVSGLNQYFAGNYEQAIHAWTRVLFLDRTHARARAYIERARSVLAERQRETDELLHRGLAALDAGDTDHARDLLASAVQRGGAVEAAEVALERLVRLSVPSGPGPDAAANGALTVPSKRLPVARHRRWAPSLLAIAGIPLLLVAIAFALRWDFVDGWAPELPRRTTTLPVPRADDSLPHPSVTDLALRRARALFARGHLHEALSELQTVRDDDPRKAEADRLAADVQRVLLEAAAAASRAPGISPKAAGSR